VSPFDIPPRASTFERPSPSLSSLETPSIFRETHESVMRVRAQQEARRAALAGGGAAAGDGERRGSGARSRLGLGEGGGAARGVLLSPRTRARVHEMDNQARGSSRDDVTDT
jgi:hypothetical protein